MPLRCRWMDPALTVLLAASLVGSALPAMAQSSLSPGYAAADARYSPAERAGREIWFFATAFNDRFFTYSYPQRLGARDRLVSDAWRQEQAATCFRPGARSPIPTAACRATRTARPRAWTRPTASSGARATTSSCSIVGKEGYRDPACDLRGCAVRHHRRRMARSISARAPATCGSAPRPARSACASFPIRASTARSGWQAQRLARRLGRLPADALGRSRRAATRASTGCSTARSSRRSASAWPAAPATSPTIR